MKIGDFRVEVSKREDIEGLGFEYSEHGKSGHMVPRIPVKLDLRDRLEYSYKEIEETLGVIFLKVLKVELKRVGVRKVHKIWWDRYFAIEPGWNVRNFTVYFNVRVESEDDIVNNEHIRSL